MSLQRPPARSRGHRNVTAARLLLGAAAQQHLSLPTIDATHAGSLLAVSLRSKLGLLPPPTKQNTKYGMSAPGSRRSLSVLTCECIYSNILIDCSTTLSPLLGESSMSSPFILSLQVLWTPDTLAHKVPTARHPYPFPRVTK
jgi:hypothetical protein